MQNGEGMFSEMFNSFNQSANDGSVPSECQNCGEGDYGPNIAFPAGWETKYPR